MKLGHLALAQFADRVAEESRHLDAQHRGDLGGNRQAEIPGHDSDEVSEARIGRGRTATSCRLVHDVVVIERPEVHKLDGHGATNGVMVGRAGAGVGRRQRKHRPEPFASGDDEIARHFGEEGVLSHHRGAEFLLDSV